LQRAQLDLRRLGNRIAQSNAGGTCYTFSATANPQNQLVDSMHNNYQYDAAGGWHILKTVETSWVAYALRRLQSVGRSSLEGATNGRQLEFTSTDRFSEAQLLDSNNTNCSRANPPDA
jgi:hypothetical protein